MTFFLQSIYFFQFLHRLLFCFSIELLFPFSIWTFLALFFSIFSPNFIYFFQFFLNSFPTLFHIFFLLDRGHILDFFQILFSMHRYGICQFFVDCIHYSHDSQFTGRKTGKFHICAMPECMKSLGTSISAIFTQCDHIFS